MSLKAQLYIFRRFFVMQYLSICKLRPIFIRLKFIRIQEMGLIFQKFPWGACSQTHLASLHACGACLLRSCGARKFEATPLMIYALDQRPDLIASSVRACFNIVNFPFLSSNIPQSPAYSVYVSQLMLRSCMLCLE